MSGPDYFSTQSDSYARYRPGYPAALFRWLADQVPARNLAWDCGCGSGQATGELARDFSWVVATDLSRAQLDQAPALPNVEYRRAPAEASTLAERSVDLVLVAQALHWFDLERFYAEVRRVLRPGGLLAAATYDLLQVTPEVDAAVRHLYHDILGPYWPPERRHIENGYRSLPFPFAEMEVPEFAMRAEWTLAHLLGYLDTWSALQLYRRDRGEDPLPTMAGRLEEAWGGVRLRPVTWPLTLRAGRVAVAPV